MHSAEALHLHSKDQTHEQYHQRHKSSKAEFIQAHKQKESATEPRHRLVQIALVFETCKPINPKYMSLGFYDVKAQITTVRALASLLYFVS